MFTGHGASTDIIVASGRAYMAALNKLLASRNGVPVAAPAVAPADADPEA